MSGLLGLLMCHDVNASADHDKLLSFRALHVFLVPSCPDHWGMVQYVMV